MRAFFGGATLGRVTLGAALLATLLGCSKPQPTSNPGGVGSGSLAGSVAQGPTVVFVPALTGSSWAVSVEVAKTDLERARGLMGRRSLAANTGMLFLFEAPEIRRFWMRNTYIPLDMLFLNERKVVVGLEENTIPLDETSRGPDEPAQYVVEVAGGEARRHGVAVGAQAEFLRIE